MTSEAIPCDHTHLADAVCSVYPLPSRHNSVSRF